jgi:hypothetical protein
MRRKYRYCRARDNVGSAAHPGIEQAVQPGGRGYLVVIDHGDEIGTCGNGFDCGIAGVGNARAYLVHVMQWPGSLARLAGGGGVTLRRVIDHDEQDGGRGYQRKALHVQSFQKPQ